MPSLSGQEPQLPDSADQNLLHCFSATTVAPARFPSPFNITPHALAQQAATSLQLKLAELCGTHDFNTAGEGKMIGVLVVQTPDQQIRYLAAFSGMLGRQWECNGFVPPVFDQQHRSNFLVKGEDDLQRLTDQIKQIDDSVDCRHSLAQLKLLNKQRAEDLQESARQNKEKQQHRALQRSRSDTADEAALTAQSREDKRRHRELKHHWSRKLEVAGKTVESFTSSRDELIKRRRQLSHQLHCQVFDGYQIANFKDVSTPMAALFSPTLPPGGAGDCAAVKLLSYCISHRLRPLCIAEFWWGASPASGVRHHAHYYPACRGKCGPILPYMLQGTDTTTPHHAGS